MPGKLSINLSTDSWILQSNADIEVRDSHFRLISTTNSGSSLMLDPGLYEVSAVLQDGQKYSKTVYLEEGGTSEVELKSDINNTRLAMSRAFDVTKTKDLSLDAIQDISVIELEPPLRLWTLSEEQVDEYGESGRQVGRIKVWKGYDTQLWNRNNPLIIADQFQRGFASTLNHLKQEELESSNVQLIGANSGVRLRSQKDGCWTYEAEHSLGEVPAALLQIGNQKLYISLPVNPCGSFPENACELYIGNNQNFIKAYAWIDPSRTIGSSMQHMLVSGYLLNAIDLAKKATELLVDKYKDPVGAVLGALLLNKSGMLESRKDWLENLSRDFDWLPDGKVLLSQVLISDNSSADICIDLLERACSQRMMFTDSYSLLLKQLRAWPFRKHETRCRKLLENLSNITPYVVWGSVTFSHFAPEGN